MTKQLLVALTATSTTSFTTLTSVDADLRRPGDYAAQLLADGAIEPNWQEHRTVEDERLENSVSASYPAQWLAQTADGQYIGYKGSQTDNVENARYYFKDEVDGSEIIKEHLPEGAKFIHVSELQEMPAMSSFIVMAHSEEGECLERSYIAPNGMSASEYMDKEIQAGLHDHIIKPDESWDGDYIIETNLKVQASAKPTVFQYALKYDIDGALKTFLYRTSLDLSGVLDEDSGLQLAIRLNLGLAEDVKLVEVMQIEGSCDSASER